LRNELDSFFAHMQRHPEKNKLCQTIASLN
jgi:hypothetical protein